ncbi:MAG: TIGR03087 family PEP-CTERM/XrtA system glycosyltransferase [Vicinamibacterales bacterium]
MRVLYLTHRLPYAPNRGDRIRSFHFVEGLRAAMDVGIVSLVHDDVEAAAVPQVADRGVDVTVARVAGLSRWLRATVALAGPDPLTHHLLTAPTIHQAVESAVARARPDVVLAMCSSMAQFALRPPLDRYPLVLDMVDVDSEKWRSLGAVSRPPKSWVYRREARVLSAFERVATERAVTTLVVNEKESDALKALAPDSDIRVISMGVDIDAFTPMDPPGNSATVVFCGVMNYPPNESGALWLVREVWPLVLQRRPDARLEIVGSQPTAAVRALARPGIVVTGLVPHTRDYLWRAAVAVAPLHTARGLQNKVFEAMAAGVPVVVTAAVHAGLPPGVRQACEVADSAPDYADRILRWLERSPAERRAHAMGVDLRPWSWAGPRGELVDVITAAAATRT